MSDAERVLARVMEDPRGARAQAATLLSQARRDRDPGAQVTALRVLGLAAHQLQDGPLAARHLRHAISSASRHGLTRLSGEARMSLALILDDLGRQRAALREIDRALGCLDGLPKARARMQRGILLRRMDRESEALETYSAALISFRRHRDSLWQARALTNRGVLLGYRGSIGLARIDLERAEQLYLELGLAVAVAQVRHNLGFVAAQAGDVVTALRWYELADEYFRRNGNRPAVALIDRAELLLAARLLPEARQTAQAAVEAAEQARLGSQVAHARLLLAQTALAAGDKPAARQAARLARRAFERQQRSRLAVLARYLELRSSNRDSSQRLWKAVAELEVAGWFEQAIEARIHLVTTGNVAKMPELARQSTAHAQATGPGPGRRGPARLRIRRWHLEALERLRNGDTAGAKRAIGAGLGLLDRYRAALGATELRVLSSADGADLAALGVRLSLRDGKPAEVLRWCERWRAATLRLRPVAMPHDPGLVADLAQLRRIGGELAAEQADPQRRQRLLRHQSLLEESVRHRTWRVAGQSTPDGTVAMSDIATALGGRALLELVEQDGELYAVVMARGQTRLQRLAPAAAVSKEVAALRFALRRLVHRHGSAASLAAAEASARHSAALLNGWLLAPVRRLIGGAEMVVVPTGALQALPWSALPDCAGRPLTVAPSATAWWRATNEFTARTPVRKQARGPVLVGAANPPAAIPEVRALSLRLGSSAVLTGGEATVQATLSAMDGAERAHVAAHGAFRADNPLFSYVSLADGPLTGHDLTGLRQAPDLMVLSACDTGLSSVHPGDELMGLTATLLGAGTRTLVASIGPVRDIATVPIMLSLHRELDAGASPAQALASARKVAGDEDWATAHSFSCFGSGVN